jgi:hypothetical protein
MYPIILISKTCFIRELYKFEFLFCFINKVILLINDFNIDFFISINEDKFLIRKLKLKINLI